ncbi:uncharacterized protein LOC129612062 [Condylostylus longicornis]|uniref:uncharacterized protein LOC129612062 n=1 Tax=Condylostylus longicornis TaxID=2530218 RepID=UPI00244E2331|nr:uncharacterized protein LOC129612062 [Condylostylus longicornis]
MRKPEPILIVIFILSSIALAINVTSIATDEWIISTATYSLASKPSLINYGLFAGFLENYLISNPFKYLLTATCNYSEGKCMYSCHKTSEKRQEEIIKIINHENLEPCDPNTENSFFHFQLKNGNIKEKANKKDLLNDNHFIGSGYWVCTVTCLIITLIFSTTGCIFSIINCFWSPVEPILNIFGLFIWNGIAAGFGFLTMIIWGILYETTLKYNVAITDTLRYPDPYSSDGLSNLGYSYFILLAEISFSLINIGLLVLRNYLLSKIPPPVIIDTGVDTMLTFY